MGWGPADVAGLTGILARSKLADAQREVTLTIDSRAQKIVQGCEIGRRVTAVRQESAKNGIKPYWCRVFAKTGTSDGATPVTTPAG